MFPWSATYGLSFESRIQSPFPEKEVAFYDVSLSTLFTVSYNRPNPFPTGFTPVIKRAMIPVGNLRTIIVIADIHRGL